MSFSIFWVNRFRIRVSVYAWVLCADHLHFFADLKYHIHGSSEIQNAVSVQTTHSSEREVYVSVQFDHQLYWDVFHCYQLYCLRNHAHGI